MTGSVWWDFALGLVAALVLVWLALIVGLILVRPRGGLLREALRLLPDVLRLIRRLAADKRCLAGFASGLLCCWPTSLFRSISFPTSCPSSATPTMPSSSLPCYVASSAARDSRRFGCTGQAPTTGSLPWHA
jgi:hypothetical protein